MSKPTRQYMLRQGKPTLPKNARIKTLEGLQKHLQWAVELEHSTIPPYLCALYSIQEGTNAEAAQIIQSVVMEEMLHMTLASNVLNAIGGSPSIDHPKFVPAYPTYLPHSDNSFKVHLQKFSKKTINTFLKIEKPAKPKAPAEPGKYHSIGQFYEAVELGLKDLTAQGIIFKKDKYRHQVTPEHYYGGGGDAIPVHNLDTALEALKEIVGQGEGVDSTIMDGDNQFGEIDELAHYFRFNEVYKGRHYKPTNTPKSGPTGGKLIVQWDQVYPMQIDPKTAKYPKGSDLWRKSYEFNRTYTTLLRKLHLAMNGEPQRLQEAVVGMYALKYQAIELMKIPVGDGKVTAGPSFEYVKGAS